MRYSGSRELSSMAGGSMLRSNINETGNGRYGAYCGYN